MKSSYVASLCLALSIGSQAAAQDNGSSFFAKATLPCVPFQIPFKKTNKIDSNVGLYDRLEVLKALRATSDSRVSIIMAVRTYEAANQANEYINRAGEAEISAASAKEILKVAGDLDAADSQLKAKSSSYDEAAKAAKLKAAEVKKVEAAYNQASAALAAAWAKANAAPPAAKTATQSALEKATADFARARTAESEAKNASTAAEENLEKADDAVKKARADSLRALKLYASLLDRDADRRFLINSILLNALEANYLLSESSRTQCVTAGSVFSAVTLGVAAVVQKSAGAGTLDAWAALGVLPIAALDVAGFNNVIPLYRDSAEALRQIHNRYIMLNSLLPEPAPLMPEDDALADNCAAELKTVTSDVNGVKTTGSDPTATAKVAVSSIAASLTAACSSYAKAKEAMAEYVTNLRTWKAAIVAFMAQDALALDYATIRRERLSRPSPHDVPGIIINAPFKAIASAFSGGSSYSYSASAALWADKDISLTLKKVDVPTIPDNLTFDTSITENLESLTPVLQASSVAAKNKALTAAKKSKSTPEVTPAEKMNVAASHLVEMTKSLSDITSIINSKLMQARASQTSFVAANNLTNLSVRIGDISPVTLAVAPATAAK